MKNFNPAMDKPAIYAIPDKLCPKCKHAMREKEKKKVKYFECVRCKFKIKAENIYSCTSRKATH